MGNKETKHCYFWWSDWKQPNKSSFPQGSYIHYKHSYWLLITRSVTLITRFVFTLWNGRRSKQALLGFIRKLLVSHSAQSREPTKKKRLGRMAADGRKTFKAGIKNVKVMVTFTNKFFPSLHWLHSVKDFLKELYTFYPWRSFSKII